MSSCQSYFEASNGSEIDDRHFGIYREALIFEVASPFVNDISYPVLVDAPQIAVGMLDADALVHMRSNGDGAGEGVPASRLTRLASRSSSAVRCTPTV